MSTELTGYSGAVAFADQDQLDHSHVFASIDVAIKELRGGRMVVIVDDEDSENEGDLATAAEVITPEAINFMTAHARGLLCLSITGERTDELELGPMTPCNTSRGGTAFAISIDPRVRGVPTGISAHDRARRILAAIDPSTRPEDLGRPGHVFLERLPDLIRFRSKHHLKISTVADLPAYRLDCESALVREQLRW